MDSKIDSTDSAFGSVVDSKMAHRDDVKRLMATCEHCGAVYAARQWPDGDVQPIGSGSCNCGSTDFVPIDGFDDGDDDSSSETSVE